MTSMVVLGALFCGLLAFQSGSTAKIDCNDGQFYIRADPESCSHFYKCDHGNPVRFTCPDSLYYNPQLHVCDWPRNVKCDVNPHQGARPNNNLNQQHNGNNAGQQYNNNAALQNHNNYDQSKVGQQHNYPTTMPYSTPSNNGNSKPSSNSNTQNYANPSNDYDALYDNLMYPVPNFDQANEVGPSVQDPLGPLERPRPTVDQLYTGIRHPYKEYLGNNAIDIRK